MTPQKAKKNTLQTVNIESQLKAAKKWDYSTTLQLANQLSHSLKTINGHPTHSAKRDNLYKESETKTPLPHLFNHF